MDNPNALYIGLGIGGMFLVIASIQVWVKGRGKTWDGIVIDKKTVMKKRDIGYGNGNYSMQEYKEYKVIIREDIKKRIHEIVVSDNDILYNYYRIRDKVRHHGKLNTYEKFDKSGDDIIFCNACASLNKMKDDVCFRCGCPLLK